MYRLYSFYSGAHVRKIGHRFAHCHLIVTEKNIIQLPVFVHDDNNI